MLTNGSGLRVSEVVKLKPHHIEAERMLVRVEQGIDIYLIKRFLGHISIQTTLVYLHVVPDRLVEVKSPLDNLRC